MHYVTNWDFNKSDGTAYHPETGQWYPWKIGPEWERKTEGETKRLTGEEVDLLDDIAHDLMNGRNYEASAAYEHARAAILARRSAISGKGF